MLTPTEELQLTELREFLKDNPEHRLAIALHEAGHIVYGLRAGAVDVKYSGPGEDPEKPGHFGMAGVHLVFPETGITVNVRTFTRYLCAGGVVKRILAPEYWVDDEDGSDYEVFTEHFGVRFPGVFTDEQLRQLWKNAEQDIEHDLRSPAFRRELWDRAREVEKRIPWGF